MRIREDTARRSDGSTGIYGVVDTPDIALVIPGDRKGFHLVELYRHPIAGRCWEFPSGNADSRLDLDAGESAARELREEAGLEASKQTPLGTLSARTVEGGLPDGTGRRGARPHRRGAREARGAGSSRRSAQPAQVGRRLAQLQDPALPRHADHGEHRAGQAD